MIQIHFTDKKDFINEYADFENFSIHNMIEYFVKGLKDPKTEVIIVTKFIGKKMPTERKHEKSQRED